MTADRSALSVNLQKILAQLDLLNDARRQQGFEFTATNMREGLDQMTRNFVTSAPDLPLVHDTVVEGPADGDYPVPVRIYHPAPDEALPVLVFSHGGGHMAGSVSVYDRIACKLAQASRHVLVSVDYRLSPECPYPAGLNDLENVLRGVFAVLQRLSIQHESRLSVAGDSGGAAITASAVHRLAADLPIARQLLIYPSLDYTLTSDSIRELGAGFMLESERIAWLFDHYFQHGEDRAAASPLHMAIPGEFPETLVVTAGFDPLRDEGQAYVERLKASGISAEECRFDDQIHAFLNLEDLVPDACARFYAEVGQFLNHGVR